MKNLDLMIKTLNTIGVDFEVKNRVISIPMPAMTSLDASYTEEPDGCISDEAMVYIDFEDDECPSWEIRVESECDEDEDEDD